MEKLNNYKKARVNQTYCQTSKQYFQKKLLFLNWFRRSIKYLDLNIFWSCNIQILFRICILWLLWGCVLWILLGFVLWTLLGFSLWILLGFVLWTLLGFVLWTLLGFVLWKILRFLLWTLLRFVLWILLGFVLWMLLGFVLWILLGFVLWTVGLTLIVRFISIFSLTFFVNLFRHGVKTINLEVRILQGIVKRNSWVSFLVSIIS